MNPKIVSFQSCSMPCLDNDTAFGTCYRLRLLLGQKVFTVASPVNLQNDRVEQCEEARHRWWTPAALSASMTENTTSGVCVSPGSAETLVRRGEITNHHLIAYSLSNISANNYQNRLMYIEVIVCNISVVSLRHLVRSLLHVDVTVQCIDMLLWRSCPT